MREPIEKLRKYIESISLTIKLPVAVFVVSLFIGLLMAALVHKKLNGLDARNLEKQWQQQMPVVAELFKLGLQKNDSLSEIQSIITLFTRNHYQSEVVIWNADYRLIKHSDSDIQELIEEQKKEEDLKIKDLELISAEAKELSKILLSKKSSYVFDTTGKSARIFFPVKLENDYFYVMLKTLSSTPVSTMILILVNYLVALLLSLLVATTAYFLGREFPKPIFDLLNSLRRFKDSGRFRAIEVTTTDEIGQSLKEIYQVLEGALGSHRNAREDLQVEPGPLAQPGDSALDAVLAQVESKATDETQFIEYLQDALYEKPLQRYKNLEVTLYPRKPHKGSFSFFSSALTGSLQDFMFAYFEENSIKANLMKHRLQEKCFDLNQEGHSAEDMGHKLWLNLDNKKEFSPGLLYLRTISDNSQAQVLRAGSFTVYARSNGEVSAFEPGESYFTSAYQGTESIDLDRNDALLIVTGDFLDAIGLNANEFFTRILAPISWAGAGKNYIADVLKQTYKELPELDLNKKLPGSLAAIVWKK